MPGRAGYAQFCVEIERGCECGAGAGRRALHSGQRRQFGGVVEDPTQPRGQFEGENFAKNL